MTILEKKVDAIARSLLGRSEQQKEIALAELKDLMDCRVSSGTVREEIDAVLTELGVPSRLAGYRYLTESIYFFVGNGNATKTRFWSVVYPEVAKICNSTPSKVERGMRHAITVCFARCDDDTVQKYFGNSIDLYRGAPTLGEFIVRLCYIVKQRTGGV